MAGEVFIFGAGGSSGAGDSELTIVGGTTRPTRPTNNTIWIDTDVVITDYILSATEPEDPVEHMAWITICDSGDIVAAAPMGDDWVTVYPVSAKQYVNGEWVRKSTKSYQNGEWVDWTVAYLYNYGKLGHTWTAVGKRIANEYGIKESAPIVTTNNGVMTIRQTTVNGGGVYYISDRIDLSGYNTLTFCGSLVPGDTHANRAMLCIWTDFGDLYTQYLVLNSKDRLSDNIVTYNISGFNGRYYIGFAVYQQNSYCQVKYIKLDK